MFETARPIEGPLEDPVRVGDLLDVTNRLIPNNFVEAELTDSQAADLAALRDSNGYYIDFGSSGEKGLARTVIVGRDEPRSDRRLRRGGVVAVGRASAGRRQRCEAAEPRDAAALAHGRLPASPRSKVLRHAARS